MPVPTIVRFAGKVAQCFGYAMIYQLPAFNVNFINHKPKEGHYESFTGYNQLFKLPENKRTKKIQLRITGNFLTNSIYGMVTVILNQLTLIRF